MSAIFWLLNRIYRYILLTNTQVIYIYGALTDCSATLSPSSGSSSNESHNEIAEIKSIADNNITVHSWYVILSMLIIYNINNSATTRIWTEEIRVCNPSYWATLAPWHYTLADAGFAPCLLDPNQVCYYYNTSTLSQVLIEYFSIASPSTCSSKSFDPNSS